MIVFVLACILRLAPDMAAREAELGTVAAAIVEASASREDAAALVAVGFWETGRSWDCSLVGDHGHSVSCWALWRCPGPTCARASTDTAYAAREALAELRASERACRALPREMRWAQYASGKCTPCKEARTRWLTAQWLLAHVHLDDASSI